AVSSVHCFGATFDVTEIAPTPPTAMIGSVMMSSPAQTAKPGSASAMTSMICCIEPLASFTPTMFVTRDRRARVSGRRFEAVRPGMLWTMSGSFVASAPAARGGLGGQGRGRAAGNVVDDERQLRGFGHRGIVRVDAVLRGLVVVGRDQQGAGGARLLGGAREAHGLRGGVRAGAGDDRDAAAREADDRLDHCDVLVVAERGGFTRRAAGHQTLHAAGDLRLDQPLERVEIDLAAPERGHQRRQAAFPHVYTSMEPSKTSTASPVIRTWEASCPSMSSGPPGSDTRTRRPVRPVRAAATAAAQAPVPQASVSPAPRPPTPIPTPPPAPPRMNAAV